MKPAAPAETPVRRFVPAAAMDLETTRTALVSAAEWAVLVIDAIAMLIIAAGTLQAFVDATKAVLIGAGEARFQRIWIRYARWLVAGLTFQLAADLIETTSAPTLEDIGKLAAIAAIRTFLNYFLERDLSEVLARTGEGAPPHEQA